MSQKTRIGIIGGGITGLAAGMATGAPVFEAEANPGGLSSSYYIEWPSGVIRNSCPASEEAFRFEVGGGHWIFGADREIYNLLSRFATIRAYSKKSAVYFPEGRTFVPYPIQENMPLSNDTPLFSSTIYPQNCGEIHTTMKEWLWSLFGKELCEIFFFPFHNLYTSGLYSSIAPQDLYKTPISSKITGKSSFKELNNIKLYNTNSYNSQFIYPVEGLDTIVRGMSKCCDFRSRKRVSRIDTKNKEVIFTDGSNYEYDTLVSTIPLNKAICLAGLPLEMPKDPHTSVLTINIAATKGEYCPDYHWLYIPSTRSKVYRVGFYSNIDNHFLPISLRHSDDFVSLYLERSYKDCFNLTDEEKKKLIDEAIMELNEWGFVDKIHLTHYQWIEVAYTWSWPNSKWRKIALNMLKKHNIYQIGRYGRWKFQGIAESIKDGNGVLTMIKN